MLYSVNCNEHDKKEIYFTNNEVMIGTDGTLYNENNFPLIEFTSGDVNWVTFQLPNNEVINIRVDVLVSVVFKCYNLPLHLLEYIELYYKDGDETNIHPSNLAHKPYSDEFTFIHDGTRYKILPNFTNYGISKDGTIIHRRTFGTTKPYKRKDNYVCFNIFSDIKQQWVNSPRHRLLCLAYKPYPDNVDSLDVNHENGIPGEDRLSNLEWRSRRYNNLHAVEYGLNATAESIEVKDFISGEVKTYPSIASAARDMGLKDSAIKTNFKKTLAGKISHPHHQYRHPTNDAWPEVTLTVEDIVRLGKLEVGGEVFNGFSDLARRAGIKRGTLSYRFNQTNYLIKNKYCRFVLGDYYCIPGSKQVYNIK